MRPEIQHFSSSPDPLDSFLGISYLEHDALSKAALQLRSKSYPRELLAKRLHDYNLSIGNDESALKNIKRLNESSSSCVITGHQLCMLGGPSYTILKGITCLQAAKAANAIPIFWLATEDHDVGEIDHAYLLDELGNLQKHQLHLASHGQAIDEIELSTHNRQEIEHFLRSCRIDPSRWPQMHPSYSATMANSMAKLFAGTGMVFVEPKLLRPLAKDFFRREIDECQQIQEILAATTKKLLQHDGQAQIQLQQGSNLFLKTASGQRKRIVFSHPNFVVDGTTYSAKELIAMIEEAPERFSTNVAARPILQSLLFPTLAYVAGPSEIAYFRQLGDYHRFHHVPMPCIIPRASASLIPPAMVQLMESLHIKPWDSIPAHWNAKFLKEQGLPSDGLHTLRNLLHPHNKLQERVLNWWGFQGQSNENLLLESLKHIPWKAEGHYYLYFNKAKHL